MKVSNILDSAADLIAKPGAWTQGAYGRDADGAPPRVFEDSVCFCAIGALARVWGVSPDEAHDREQGMRWPGFNSLGLWNDDPERTQAEVVQKLREAAAKAREQGQ